MNELSLSSGRIWAFADETGDTIRLSLPDVLRCDTLLTPAPVPGYLSPIQLELLTSILQVVVDSIWPRGLSKKDYQQLLKSDKSESAQPLLDQICRQLEIIKGFSLIGTSGFLQVPLAWRASDKKMDIARLIWPFIPNVNGSSAKGLRGMCPPPGRLGPDLTALYLYSSCCLSRGGSRYWGSGNLAGKAVLHCRSCATMRQQLFGSVLPGCSPFWKPLQPLPWVSQCRNNRGLEADDRPPCWIYLNGKKKIRGTANSRFFLARAMVLEPPEYGYCDISGEYGRVFTSYRLLKDSTAHEMILQYKPLRRQVTYVGIMRQMYEKKDHPAVAGHGREQKESNKKSEKFSLPYHGYSIPCWYALSVASDYPSQTLQTGKSLSGKTFSGGQTGCSLFLLKYHKKNQDVRGLFQYTWLESDSQFADRARILKQIAVQTVQQLHDGKDLLFSGTKGKKKKKKTADDHTDSTMVNGAQQLWNLADKLLYTQDWDEGKSGQWLVEFAFHKTLIKCWQQLLEDNWDNGCLTLSDRYHEFKVTCMVLGENEMENDREYIDTLPMVRAGRVFARTYHQLDRQKKAQLCNEGHPVVSRYFWQCMNRARREDPSAFQPMFEMALPLLEYIHPVENGNSLGKTLRLNSRFFKSRRIELLFLEQDQELLLDQVQQMFHTIVSRTGRSVSFDLGAFLHDIKQLHFHPDRVIRRWATDYFRENTHNKTEEIHV